MANQDPPLGLPPLPAGYFAEPLNESTISAAAATLSAARAAERGVSDVTESEFRDDISGMDFDTETVVIRAPDGSTAAYADIDNRSNVRFTVYACVRPDQTGRGLGRYLVGWGETKAAEALAGAPDDAMVVIRHLTYDANQASNRLLESMGYPHIRSTFIMSIEATDAVPDPFLPPGIQIRTFNAGHDMQAGYEAYEESFADVWGRPRGSFEDFVGQTKRSLHDADLWFLAWDGSELAGLAFGTLDDGLGWIDVVGVRRAWRGRGIGLALLHSFFRVAARKGAKTIELSVDAQSLTGADRLYERAGMTVAHRYNLRSKTLREGRDFSAVDSL